MFGLLVASLFALTSAQVLIIPENLEPKVRGPIATRIGRLPGGGIGLFDAEDAEDLVIPEAGGMLGRIIRNQHLQKDKWKRERIEQMIQEELMRTEAHRIAQERLSKSKRGVRFGAEDLDNSIFPLSPRDRDPLYLDKLLKPFHKPKVVYAKDGSDVDALENKPHWSVTVGNKDDLENAWLDRPGHVHTVGGGRIGCIRQFAAEDLEDKTHWSVTIGNQDEVENGGVNWGEITKIAGQVHDIGKVLGFAAEDAENGGINWSEITKIAGQVNEIGHILGFDADDADDSVTVATACAIIGAACALANTGCNIYSHVKGSDKAEELTNGGINWGEITKIAGQVHDIGKVLGFAAEDLEDKTHWSVTIGNKDEVENGRVNWAEVTKVAGQIYEIGKTLGFGAEDLDDWSISVGVKGTF